MKIKLIKTVEDYEQAIAFMEEIGDRKDFQDNDELISDFELLSILIDCYEKANYSINPGHPIDIIQLKMEYLGLKRKDLVHIASSGVLSEVFNKKRGLSKKMIRQFSDLLNIDQNLLNTQYDMEVVTAPALRRARGNFQFIKRNLLEIERFKGQIRQNGMIFNMAGV